MARSKRENYLIIGVAAAVGMFLLDSYVLGPFVSAREAIAAGHQVAADRLSEERKLFKRERDLRRVWNEMVAAGVEANAPEAERKMLHALQGWAQQSGVANVSLRPERTNDQHGFVRVSVQLSGTGPSSAMAKLIWCIESSAMPVRIESVQLSPSKPGVDDLQLQLTTSRLCAVPEREKKSDAVRQSVASGEGRR